MYFREYFCSFSSKSYYFYFLGVSHLKFTVLRGEIKWNILHQIQCTKNLNQSVSVVRKENIFSFHKHSAPITGNKKPEFYMVTFLLINTDDHMNTGEFVDDTGELVGDSGEFVGDSGEFVDDTG